MALEVSRFKLITITEEMCEDPAALAFPAPLAAFFGDMTWDQVARKVVSGPALVVTVPPAPGSLVEIIVVSYFLS